MHQTPDAERLLRGASLRVTAPRKAVLAAVHEHPHTDTDTLLRATLDGAGITSLPVELAAPYLGSQELVRVLPDWITGRFTLFAAMPSRRFVPRRTQVFLDYLIKETRLRLDVAMRAG